MMKKSVLLVFTCFLFLMACDRIPPVLTLNGEAAVTVGFMMPFEDPGALAFDEEDKDLTGAIVVYNNVDTSREGEYTVTYNVSDKAGNFAGELVRTVSVKKVPLKDLAFEDEKLKQAVAESKAEYVHELKQLPFIVECGSLKGLEALWFLETLSLQQFKGNDFSPLKGLVNLKQLILLASGFKDPSLLAELTRLEVLSLGGNELKELPPALPVLRNLDLRQNRLTSLDGIGRFEALTELNIENNLVSDITPLKELPALQTLLLGNDPAKEHTNIIEDFESLRGLTALENLYLDHSDFKAVEILPLFTGLKQLSLASTGISSLDFVKELEELTYLDLSGCTLKSFEPLKEAAGLKTLLVGECRFPMEALQFLSPALNRLGLSGNSLEGLTGLERLTELFILDLSRNRGINDFSSLASLSLLKTLVLEDMALESLAMVSELKGLNLLYAPSNNIKDLKALESLTALTELDVRGNEIKEVGPLENLKKLSALDLEDNPVVSIEALAGLPALKRLNLKGAALENPCPLGSMKSLKWVDLSGIPMLTEPFKVLKEKLGESLVAVPFAGVDSSKQVHPIFTRPDFLPTFTRPGGGRKGLLLNLSTDFEYVVYVRKMSTDIGTYYSLVKESNRDDISYNTEEVEILLESPDPSTFDYMKVLWTSESKGLIYNSRNTVYLSDFHYDTRKILYQGPADAVITDILLTGAGDKLLIQEQLPEADLSVTSEDSPAALTEDADTSVEVSETEAPADTETEIPADSQEESSVPVIKIYELNLEAKELTEKNYPDCLR